MDNKLANDQVFILFYLNYAIIRKKRDLNLEFLNPLEHQDLSIELQEHSW